MRLEQRHPSLAHLTFVAAVEGLGARPDDIPDLANATENETADESGADVDRSGEGQCS